MKRGRDHPIYTFLEYGIPVAICTDNTTVSATNQNRENEEVARRLPLEQLCRIHQEAKVYSFIKNTVSPQDVSPSNR